MGPVGDVSIEATMSAMGQKADIGLAPLMSALPPKADIGTQSRNVRFVPIADISQIFDQVCCVPQRNSAKPTAMRPAITTPRTTKKVHLT